MFATTSWRPPYRTYPLTLDIVFDKYTPPARLMVPPYHEITFYGPNYLKTIDLKKYAMGNRIPERFKFSWGK